MCLCKYEYLVALLGALLMLTLRKASGVKNPTFVSFLLLSKIVVSQMVDTYVMKSAIFHDAKLLVNLLLDPGVAVQRIRLLLEVI